MGLNAEDYAGLSFCIGAATTAAAQGVEDSTIRSLGRWRSTAFLSYVHSSGETLAEIAPNLSNTGESQGTPRVRAESHEI